MTFIKHHKHHLGAFVILIIIAVVSGYFVFKTNITQNTINKTQTNDTAQKTTTTTQDTRNKIQTNTKNQNTNVDNLTPAVEASGLTAGQAIQQLINSVAVRVNDQDYQTEFVSSTTVFDLMDKLKSEGRLSFSGKEYSSMGFFVDEINGVKNDNLAGKYWIYYINGQSAQVGISNNVLKPNDLIEWKYEKAKF